MDSFFSEYLPDLVAPFIDPKKRIYLGYILVSILIAFGWLLLARRQSPKAAFLTIFDSKILLSASAKADYALFFLNRILFSFLGLSLFSQLAIATFIYEMLHHQAYLSPQMFSDINHLVVISLFTFCFFIIDDVTRYVLHRWLHRVPFLWAFHKVHHSATTLNPMTVFRTHPVEGILFNLRGALAQGTCISLFYYAFGNSIDLWTVFGVNIGVFVFHAAGSNLRHSHVHISYWPWLEKWIISPAQHQIHHSVAPKHYDKNFGVALACWDWFFGTLHYSEEYSKRVTMKFGLGSEAPMTSHRLADLYLAPFKELCLPLLRPLMALLQNKVNRGKSP